MKTTPISDALIAHLSAAAEQVAANAYAPYSQFRVGAALLLSDGTVVTGTNVENMSFGLTICAERSAIVRAISEFGPSIRILAVAVTNLNGASSPPCGACRQMLSEFITADAPILFPGDQGREKIPFAQLFPHTFQLTQS